MHLAPRMDSHDMGDSDRLGTFTYVARQLGARKLGWIATREAEIGPDTKLVDSQGRPREIKNRESISPAIKAAFGGAFIANEGFDQASAQNAIAEGRADAVAFGKLFIANPDLPKRFAQGLPLNKWDSATFYSPGPHGYTDYPSVLEPA
jgi:2,4-dienoyl-CoA reductase-like NADH-dependent reductase (Old Yellow Enzyme family)